MKIYNSILQSKKNQKKLFAILIDPENTNTEQLRSIVKKSNKAQIDLFLIGGSLITKHTSLEKSIEMIKNLSNIPVIIFPGGIMDISDKADGILFLSLISGRNPEMLIGNHVLAAPRLKNSSIEVISTGYILIDTGSQTSVSYMSNTNPIPYDKHNIATSTSIAGEMLGLKMIYLEGGSGAQTPISNEMIRAAKQSVSIPIIVGGGINSGDIALEKCKAGADIIVVVNAIEKNETLIQEISDSIHQYKNDK